MGVLHPMDAKMQLAHTVVAGFHGEEAAKEAAEEFRLVYRDRKAPTDLPEMKLAVGHASAVRCSNRDAIGKFQKRSRTADQTGSGGSKR